MLLNFEAFHSIKVFNLNSVQDFNQVDDFQNQSGGTAYKNISNPHTFHHKKKTKRQHMIVASK